MLQSLWLRRCVIYNRTLQTFMGHEQTRTKSYKQCLLKMQQKPESKGVHISMFGTLSLPQNKLLQVPSGLSYTQPCRFRQRPNYPPLREDELEEQFQRGSGPGGQNVNKTTNAVVLKHVPTGIVVKCHESRSKEKNRELARKHMQERLDFHFHGENSFLMQQKREQSKIKKEKRAKTQERLEKLRAFKEREGID